MSLSNLSRVDLNLLRPLHALLATANVSRAAEQMAMSQPAMSRALARLRQDFGDPLLVRSGPAMRLTPFAETLAGPLRALLGEAAALYRGADFDPASADRVFRAAIPDVVAAPLLPRVIALLAAEAPGCRLDLVPPNAAGAAERALDFALSAEARLFAGMRMEPLFQDFGVLVIRMSRARELDPEDAATMLDRPHVAVVPPGLDEDPVDRWLRSIGQGRRIGAVVPQYLQALHLVSRGELVAILPSRLCTELGGPLGLIGVGLPLAQQPEQHWIFYPPEAEADPASRWLRGLVRRAADVSPGAWT